MAEESTITLFAMNKTKKSFLKFPTYTDIFKNGQEKIIANLSKEGLAEKYIVFTTSISSLLYVSHFKSFHVQELIMMEFKDVLLGTDDGRLIVDWLLSNNQKTLNINNYTLMEMYCMLLKYKKGLCGNDNVSLTKDEQLLYLKLVLIANERRTNSMEKVHKNLDSIIRNDRFEYEKMFWPILLQEIDINEVPRIEYEMFRIKYFVEGVINKYPKAEAIIDKFFQRKGFDNYRLYASYLASFFMKFIMSYTNDGELRPGIKENEQNRKLFAHLVVNDTIPKTYLELKSHPVYYFNGGYYVIHWNYLINQIFIGMFMALKNELNECGLKNIKKECGKIIEHTLFKNVLITAFSNSWQRYAFDNEDNGMPDAIFRMGNNLFILELKDNLMGEDVMESFDYTHIESHINRNFIQSEKGKKKGIKQLAVYIKTLITNGYEAIGV